MFEAERKRSKPCNFPSLPRALSVYVLCSERKIVPLTITHSRTPQPTFLLTKERERGRGRGAHNSSHCKQHKKGGASETTRFSPPGGEPKELAKQYFPFSERAGENSLARSLEGKISQQPVKSARFVYIANCVRKRLFTATSRRGRRTENDNEIFHFSHKHNRSRRFV